MRKPPSHIRIGVFSYRCDEPHCKEPPKSISFHAEQVKLASSQAKDKGCHLLILPGYSLGKGVYRSITEGKRILQSIADDHDLIVLGEVDDTYWFQPRKPLGEPMKQHFAKSSQGIRRKREFMNDFDSGRRTLELNGISIKVMLCGENNILKTRPHLAMPKGMEWSWDYDVIVNPTHDSATRPELWKRYAHWSKEGRNVIHTTNNFRRTTWDTAIRIYRNGEMFRDANSCEPTAPHQRWRLVVVDVPE